MTDTSTTPTPVIIKDSALAKFNLGFEYDRTWAQAKQTVQHRPLKNSR
ncbi:MAG: hypothetical protein QG549_704 [Patescibacteria group bacterium]|nr:hypothetical protein [Patescibacteria group bacterium]